MALDLAAGHQAPPAGVFETLLDAIDAGEAALSGTLTRRAGRATLIGQWGCAAWYLCEAS